MLLKLSGGLIQSLVYAWLGNGGVVAAPGALSTGVPALTVAPMLVEDAYFAPPPDQLIPPNAKKLGKSDSIWTPNWRVYIRIHSPRTLV